MGKVINEQVTQGGWLLLALGGLALIIYYTIFYLVLHLRAHVGFDLSKDVWREMVEKPESASPTLQTALGYGNDVERAGITSRMEEVRMEHLAVVDRRLPFLFILISAAPLVGLLGTVAGMLTTFQGLGGLMASPLDTISKGISQALVTTQAGLIIAIPAYVAGALIRGKRDRLEASLTQLESALRASDGTQT